MFIPLWNFPGNAAEMPVKFNSDWKTTHRSPTFDTFRHLTIRRLRYRNATLDNHSNPISRYYSNYANLVNVARPSAHTTQQRFYEFEYVQQNGWRNLVKYREIFIVNMDEVWAKYVISYRMAEEIYRNVATLSLLLRTIYGRRMIFVLN